MVGIHPVGWSSLRIRVLGVSLTPILKREQTSFKALYGKSFAVDASIELHQFLALIRRPDGSLFTDPRGRVTSHLIGLLTRTSRLVTDYKLRPVFVFDGRPNPLKRATIEARRKVQQKAQAEYVQAVEAKDYSRAWSKVVMTGRVTGEILADAKRLLSLMGIPWLEALEDGEAQASFMAAKGDVWAVGSKDYDCLLFGAPILARYLTLTGREYLPSKKTSRPLIPELVKLEENLEALGISREQLVDLALLVGTDFNEGVMGIGPKKGLALIRKYGVAEKFPEEIRSELPEDLNGVRNIFLHPRVLENYSLQRGRPNPDGLIEFLNEERAFKRDRVQKVADKLTESHSESDSQLGKWLA
ncbi:flap endonuclease-1 [Candidatus Bathyarchaeota archaeon]|nr:MAG: flap endonuclease-1 [Candidatus Bathyarchaeota archaeon]